MKKNYGIYPQERNYELGKLLANAPAVFDISSIISTNSADGNIGYVTVYQPGDISILFNMPAPVDTHIYVYVNYGPLSGVLNSDGLEALPLKMTYDTFDSLRNNTPPTPAVMYESYLLANINWVTQSCLAGQSSPYISDTRSPGESRTWLKMKIIIPANTTCINLPLGNIAWDSKTLDNRAVTFAAVVPTGTQGMLDYVNESETPAIYDLMHWGAIIMHTRSVG